MLAAIAQRCLERGIQPAVLPWIGSYDQRAKLGLWQIAWYQRFKLHWHKVADILPARLAHQYGIVRESEITVVLDASGFQLGDQWGERIASSMADRLCAAKASGKKVILLPQAFGPFSSLGMKDAARRIIKAADLIFARDPESYSYIGQLAPNSQKIQQSPDFTCLISGEPTRVDIAKKTACILPNMRMLDKNTPLAAQKYMDFLKEAVRVLEYQGYEVCSLIHETVTDQGILDRLNEDRSKPLRTLKIADAREVKTVLGMCEVVIASRFHALVSALSQGVPCIATGWSHKYSHLMRDYDSDDWLIDLTEQSSSSFDRIDRLLSERSIVSCRERLLKKKTTLVVQSENMWDKVFCELAK